MQIKLLLREMEKIAEAFRKFLGDDLRTATFIIEGHTDARGRAEFNKTLSQRRAEAVRTALVSRGVAAERVIAEGFGPDKPLADNTSDEGRARNRRIEIKIIPPT